jgi:hypothetical protein
MNILVRIIILFQEETADKLLNYFLVSFFTARHHHHRHPYSKKITHQSFPKGGYLLVHYPFAQHIFSSNNHQISNSLHDSDTSNGIEEMSNDILTQDMESRSSSSHRHADSMKNKYNLKFKRNANANPVMIEACCTNPPQDSCKIHHCH